jgi:CheY-like chemotaxis protein
MIKVTLVDDDPNFGFVAEMLFRRFQEQADLNIYQVPQTFLEHVEEQADCDILLLDINMPQLNGWEVLDSLESLADPPTIYMLSSSIDKHDINRAQKHKLVRAYLAKPLTTESIQRILDESTPQPVG